MFAELINAIAKSSRRPFGEYRPRPSSAGPERCIRQLTYDAQGVTPTPLPGRAVLRMDDSSWHELLTRDWFAKTVCTIHSEQMAIEIPAPGLNKIGYLCEQPGCGQKVAANSIHGHLDWLALDPLGRDWMVEHKAIDHFRFQTYEKAEEVPLDYLTQTACYSHGLQLLQPNLTRIVLILKNKNTAQYLEYLGEYDLAADTLMLSEMISSYGDAPAKRTKLDLPIPRIVDSALHKFREIEAHRVAGTLPDRPFEYGTVFPCDYCQHHGTCWKGYVSEIQALSQDVALDEELATTARYYNELGAQASEIKKERDGLKARIKAALRGAKAQSGRSGEYLIGLTFAKHQVLNYDLIPKEAIGYEPSERLTVKKIEGDSNEVHPHQRRRASKHRQAASPRED